MKNFLILFLITLSTVCLGQSTVQLRGDTVKIWKNGGSAELIVQNGTKDSTNGVLTNVGNGRTTFLKFRTSQDSLFLGNVFIGLVGSKESIINFDYPPAYVIVNGDTTDINGRQWAIDYINDSINAKIAQVARDSAKFYNVGNTGVRIGQLYQDGFGVSRLIAGSDLSITKNLDSSITISLTSDFIVNQNLVKEAKSAWITRVRADSGRFDSYLNVIGNGTATQNMFRVQLINLNDAFKIRNNGTSLFGNNFQVYPISAATGVLQPSGTGIRFAGTSAADRGFTIHFASQNTRSTDSSVLSTSPAGNLLLNENFTVGSGNGMHAQLAILGTINQTLPNATGITQGILINQTITSAADYAAIRVINGTIKARSYQMTTAGDKLSIATGSNASIGTATLAAGTVTVNTTAVTASSIIIVSCNTPGGTQGFLSAPVASIVAGTSFTINSSSNTDTSTVNWWIIN